MSRTPLVSVCVSAYNYGRFLDDCILSVQQQTLSDWELVVCDDCSTDGTEELVRSYASADPRIRYVRNERRLGMNGNVKRAADTGTGRYLKTLCADDWMVPHCLETLCDLMERHPSAALATSAVTQTDEVGVPLSVEYLFGEPVSVVPGEAMLDRMARGGSLGGHSCFLIRASAYREVNGYDDSLLYAADLDLGARLCRIGDFIHTDEPLFYGREHGVSSSSVNPGKLWDVADYFEIPRKIFQPRRPFNREWRRYQRLTAIVTSRYTLNFVLENMRGHHEYARGLGKILFKKGNFPAGLLYLTVDAPRRLVQRLMGRNRLPQLPLPPGGKSVAPTRQASFKSEAPGCGGRA